MEIDETAFSLFFDQCDNWDVDEEGAREAWDADPELRQFWRRQVVLVVRKIWSPFKIEWVGKYDIRVLCDVGRCEWTEFHSLGSDNGSVWADHGKKMHSWLFGDGRE